MAEQLTTTKRLTLLDGLVLARAAMHHSVNYRCVGLFGIATKVIEQAEKRRAFVVAGDPVQDPAQARTRDLAAPAPDPEGVRP